MKQFLKKKPGISHLLTMSQNLNAIASEQGPILQILLDNYLHENLYNNPRYRKPEMLNRFERKHFSQSGEDGLISEIFSRIGETNRHFIEFGVQDGLESNTTYLLFQDWRGHWFEGNTDDFSKAVRNLDVFIRQKQLDITNAYITPENFENTLRDRNVPDEPDLLSIDIDFNDYWVWKSLERFRPRVVIIEYNAFFHPPVKFVAKYDEKAVHEGNTYFGASLKSLELLGREKGYQLVGCGFSGVNAFFVREDLSEDKFARPATAETFYEPFRSVLIRKTGLLRQIGPFESI